MDAGYQASTSPLNFKTNNSKTHGSPSWYLPSQPIPIPIPQSFRLSPPSLPSPLSPHHHHHPSITLPHSRTLPCLHSNPTRSTPTAQSQAAKSTSAPSAPTPRNTSPPTPNQANTSPSRSTKSRTSASMQISIIRWRFRISSPVSIRNCWICCGISIGLRRSRRVR